MRLFNRRAPAEIKGRATMLTAMTRVAWLAIPRGTAPSVAAAPRATNELAAWTGEQRRFDDRRPTEPKSGPTSMTTAALTAIIPSTAANTSTGCWINVAGLMVM